MKSFLKRDNLLKERLEVVMLVQECIQWRKGEEKCGSELECCC